MICQQFFGTRPSQPLTTIDPFWHHEIAALEGHNNRKLVANVVVQLHDGCNVPNRIANLERGSDKPQRSAGRFLEAGGYLAEHPTEIGADRSHDDHGGYGD